MLESGVTSLQTNLRTSLLAALSTSESDTALLQQQASLVSSISSLNSGCPKSGDFNLSCCCGSVQIQIIVGIAVYSIVIFFLWDFQILLPLKLIVVAIHEFSHALAAWMTCGSVESIEVHGNEGGVTKTRGGSRFFILSAGYLGSAFWGMIMIIAAADYYGVQVVSGLLGIALLISLFFARNAVLVALNVFFLLLLAGFWACTILTPFNGLRWLILLIGTMSSLFSIYDVYSDLLARRVNESDATMLANHTHTSSRCWGAIWAVISICFFGLGVYLSLVVGSSANAK